VNANYSLLPFALGLALGGLLLPLHVEHTLNFGNLLLKEFVLLLQVDESLPLSLEFLMINIKH